MVVLDEHHVEQAEAVVMTTPVDHGPLLPQAQPGTVFRVSTTTAPVPTTARAKRRACVATPDRWLRRLSMVRSAVRMLRAGPSMAASLSPSFT